MNTVELGRQMMANAAMLDDDAEFNQWARLGPLLIELGTNSPKAMGSLSPEEQQVVARAMNKLSSNGREVA